MRSPDLRRTVEILHSHRPGALATDVHPQAPAPHASFAAGGREEKIEYLGLLCGNLAYFLQSCFLKHRRPFFLAAGHRPAKKILLIWRPSTFFLGEL